MKKTVILTAFVAMLVVVAMIVGGEVGFSQSSVELNDSYNVGQTVQIPDYSFDVNGKTYSAQSVVYYPNGSGIRAKTVNLTEQGLYTVHYFVEVDGKTYSHDVTFKAIANLVAFNTSESEFFYGQTRTSWNTGGTNGLNVRIANGDVMKFSEPIELGDKDTPIISYYLTCENGFADASALYFEFVDAVNPNNKLTVWCKVGGGNGDYMYFMSKANEQPYVGIQQGWSGAADRVHINNSYGTPVSNRLNKQPSDATLFGFTYDSVDHYLYINGFKNNDLDGSYQSDAWAGFTSDYVFLNVYASGYVGSHFNLLIKSIGNCNLTKQSAEDTEGPQITIDSNNVDINSLPDGFVGCNYTLAKATASDIYANGKSPIVTTRVLYGYSRASGYYNTPNESYLYELSTKGGVFTPISSGRHSIVYSSYDFSGNYSELVYDVTISDNNPLPIDFELTESDVYKQAYNTVYLSNVTSCQSVIPYSVRYSVTCNGQEQKVLGNEASGHYFVPTSAGAYSVTVKVVDYVGNSTSKQYGVTVVDCVDPAFDAEASLPKYFIAELPYQLPVLYAKDYLNGGKQVKADVLVTDGLGSRFFNNGTISFIADEDGFATIKYIVGNNEKIYKIPVISVSDGEDLLLDRYFVDENGILDISSNEYGVVLSTRNQPSMATFVKSVLDNRLQIALRVPTTENAFDAVTVVLQDAVYSEQKVSLVITNGISSSLVINGVKTNYNFENVFNSNKLFSVVYSKEKHSVSIGDGLGEVIKTTVYGERFEGFTSGTVYVSVGLDNVKARSTVYVSKINNQTFNSSIYSDRISPEVYFDGVYSKREVSLGETVDVYKVFAGDVLSNLATQTVSVKFGDNYAKDVNGVVLNGVSAFANHSFVADKYGQYTISYSVYDTAGRKQLYNFIITVPDDVAPTISVEKPNYKSVKIGDTVSIAKASATDNIDENVTVYVYVLMPDHTTFALKGNDKYFVGQVGTYTVRYFAIDQAGNTSYVDYTFESKGE